MFDPFADFETAGYLRNELGLKDPARIKVQEHLFFTANLPDAAASLAARDEIAYADFCNVHRTLFAGFYPWAGQDRHALDTGNDVAYGNRDPVGRSRYEAKVRARHYTIPDAHIADTSAPRGGKAPREA